MGKAGVVYREIRGVFEGPEGQGLLQVYVLCEAWGDCPTGVQGWHHKTFAPDVHLASVLSDWGSGKEDPLMWPLNAPSK
jgi:hypothetical protein